MPTLPPWDALHPVAVHFPVAFLVLAPLLTLVALLSREGRVGMTRVAFLVALLGAMGASLAVQTGEATEDRARIPEAAESVLHEHEEMAERAPLFAWGLAIGLGALVLIPMVRKREMKTRSARAVLGMLLVLQLAATLYIANTAHLGGRLVHEFGVRAPWPTDSSVERDD